MSKIVFYYTQSSIGITPGKAYFSSDNEVPLPNIVYSIILPPEEEDLPLNQLVKLHPLPSAENTTLHPA